MEALALTADDPGEPQRGASDPGASVWVAASAGTGKTKVLSDRVLRLMLNGTEPRRILCLTFTKAAAAEMANRIRERLGGWAVADEPALRLALRELLGGPPSKEQQRWARSLFTRVLDTPGGLGIQTIHAFCQSLLGRFPLEADIAPHARPMDERDALELRRRALYQVLEQANEGGGTLGKALACLTGHLGEARFSEILNDLFSKPGRFENLIAGHGSTLAAAEATSALLGLGPDETASEVINAACRGGGCDEPALRKAAAALARGTNAEQARAARMAAWLEADAPSRAEMFNLWAGVFLTDKEEKRSNGNLATNRTQSATPGVLAAMCAEAERLLCVLPRRRAAVTAEATRALLLVGVAVFERYRRLKQSRSLLDYDDLVAGAVRLLEGHGGDWILYKLDGGIDHLLIDEAQDTSPEQWRVLHALTTEFFAGEGSPRSPRTIFAVGDVKQSIFSFQGAEPRAFLESRDRYRRLVTGAGQHWRPIEMKTSFRSTRAVLQAVDATFKPAGMTYAIALEHGDVTHQAYRKLDGGSVELWPPLKPRPPAKSLAWDPPVERVEPDSPQARLARLIALRIAGMLESRELLQAKGLPVRPGDFMVLVRRRTPFMQALIRELKNHQVPVAGIDRMLLCEQLAVMDLLALIRFALLPEDDLTLATVLKSPLLGFDDDMLFSLAHGRSGSLWMSLREAAGAGCRNAQIARHLLSRLLAEADRLTPFDFLMRALGPPPPDATSGCALAESGRRRLLARLGRDAEDPIAELLEAALAFERDHPPSLQGFIAWLERAEVEIKRDPETSSVDAIRVMTVHGAKGLQAPIVFLPDSCQTPQEQFPLLWPTDEAGREVLLWPPRAEFREQVAERERQQACERQYQEHMRLLYVAMTRAADRLIVCGWLNGRQTDPDPRSWYSLVKGGLKRESSSADMTEDVDPFLAGQAALIDEATVLRLSCPHQAAIEPVASAAETRGPMPLPAWATLPAPSEPWSSRPLRPSHPEDEKEPTVASPLLSEQRFRRGRLIHRLLQELPELPPESRAAAAQRWLARPTHGLSAAEQSEIAAEVTTVLTDPRLAAVFGPGSRAEVPLSGVVAGRLIAGQIDRLVLTRDTVTVLDLKSDRPPPRAAENVHAAYLRQMSAYRALLREVFPERVVRCLLLWTHTPAVMPLDDVLLDRWAP
jgi:ATP-dependent helicase/nuclease subunit A